VAGLIAGELDDVTAGLPGQAGRACLHPAKLAIHAPLLAQLRPHGRLVLPRVLAGHPVRMTRLATPPPSDKRGRQHAATRDIRHSWHGGRTYPVLSADFGDQWLKL
jgi:hypothetical protein